ncbi:MAG: cytochrome d ubiquinol oxidase subunit II [Rhodospirillaceae bacterium]|jgi:cytochrome bd ubiquinol oxidase subunit II|nr:cytochrome d ubiquinol oxidase subunit II [Rhodospirillaceae bacterium]MBT5752808.1 cytochrome d ubiquinol oxidase subunit II [Rhodospirillaceae bacterium]
MPIDYETLRVIWWALMGILLIGFAVMDGFDLGIAALLPYLSRNDTERRVLLETIEPVWDGNQVWLILGAGASFAAWPQLYATSFSGFYHALILVLWALILRPVGLGYRNKMAGTKWRQSWDRALVVSGFVPSLVFGVAFGNLLLGTPFHFDDTLRPFYTGSLFELLNPFALLCGLVSLTMLMMHGSVYAALKTTGEIAARATKAATLAALVLIVLFTLGGLWITFGIDGYVIISGAEHGGPSNPLYKTVIRETGAWIANYGTHPWTMLAPGLGYAGALGTIALLRAGANGLAFITSALSVAGIVATAGLSLFPFIMPSSSDPSSSLTVWDSSSSHLTLFIMLLCAAFFMPLIIAYTSWVFRVMRGKVTAEHLDHDQTY